MHHCVNKNCVFGQKHASFVFTLACRGKNMIVEANQENFEREVFDARNITVLLDFTADWCDLCQRQTRQLQAFSRRKDVKVVRVPVEQCPNIAMAFDLDAVPMLCVVRNGKILRRSVGYRDQAAVEALIDACTAKIPQPTV